MVRYRHLLLGIKFRWYTDHKGLTYLLKQKGLTGRQARWLEKIGEFDFEVHYVPGEQNTLVDALSRMYSEDKSGTVRAQSEYTVHDEGLSSLSVSLTSAPVLVGAEARALAIKPALTHLKQAALRRLKNLQRELDMSVSSWYPLRMARRAGIERKRKCPPQRQKKTITYQKESLTT
jgi:hypothetical protein